MLKYYITPVLIMLSLIGISQRGTLTVRNNDITEIEYIIPSETDSVNVELQTEKISLTGFGDKNLYFSNNQVYIFNINLSPKTIKNAKKNGAKFLKKITKLKNKKKLDFIKLNCSMKLTHINRFNIITEDGYAYYRINNKTKDTLVKNIIAPSKSYDSTFKHSYEIKINGDIFKSNVLYSNQVDDDFTLSNFAKIIKSKIKKTIPIGKYKANKALNNKKYIIEIKEINYFDKKLNLYSEISDRNKTAYKLVDDSIIIESEFPIFEKGIYNKHKEEFKFKDDKTKITFKKCNNC